MGALVTGGVTALPVPEHLGGDGVGLFEVALLAGGSLAPSRRRWQHWSWGGASLLGWHPPSNETASWPGWPKEVLTAALNSPGRRFARTNCH